MSRVRQGLRARRHCEARRGENSPSLVPTRATHAARRSASSSASKARANIRPAPGSPCCHQVSAAQVVTAARSSRGRSAANQTSRASASRLAGAPRKPSQNSSANRLPMRSLDAGPKPCAARSLTQAPWPEPVTAANTPARQWSASSVAPRSSQARASSKRLAQEAHENRAAASTSCSRTSPSDGLPGG